jgi:hypothetical protein
MSLQRFSEYGKLYEARKYSKNIYWDHQLDEVLDMDWTDIRTLRIDRKYSITFETDDKDGGYIMSVYLDIYRGVNKYMLEERAIQKFINKFKKEFEKHPTEYVKNFKFDPKCLGDLDLYRTAEKFNM